MPLNSSITNEREKVNATEHKRAVQMQKLYLTASSSLANITDLILMDKRPRNVLMKFDYFCSFSSEGKEFAGHNF